MKTTTHGLFNNLINNYYLAKSCNRWEYGLVNHLVALTYTINNNNFNGSEFLEISNYIKKKPPYFS